MNARRLAYLFMLVVVLVFAGQSSRASIVWGSCAEDAAAAAQFGGPCPDSYDYEVCGVDALYLNECNCENHGYAWVNDECVDQ